MRTSSGESSIDNSDGSDGGWILGGSAGVECERECRLSRACADGSVWWCTVRSVDMIRSTMGGSLDNKVDHRLQR